MLWGRSDIMVLKEDKRQNCTEKNPNDAEVCTHARTHTHKTPNWWGDPGQVSNPPCLGFPIETRGLAQSLHHRVVTGIR